MELIREHFRSIIFHNFDELKLLNGNEAPSYSTMKHWFN